VARGELAENQKLSGRSLLASIYSVSPETIRRALKRLADMKVVVVRKNSGVYILSADNAKRYLKATKVIRQDEESQERARQLLEEIRSAGHELLGLVESRIDAVNVNPESTAAFPQYELKVGKESPITGTNLAELKFWARTGATIVAIRRARSLILSPGPNAELYTNDIIYYVGEPESRLRVEAYVNGMSGSAAEEQRGAEQ